jgi:hypothetical protein
MPCLFYPYFDTTTQSNSGMCQRFEINGYYFLVLLAAQTASAAQLPFLRPPRQGSVALGFLPVAALDFPGEREDSLPDVGVFDRKDLDHHNYL